MRSEKEREKEKLFKKLKKKVAASCLEHELLTAGDRVLVGLSGGKDSFVLLELLSSIKKSLPFSIELIAVHVKVDNVGFRTDLLFLEKFCRDLGVKFHRLEIDPEFEKTAKSPCFICSWNRRKAIFNLGKELNCNKIAFGHHRDDALETFMMNMLYHGSMSSLPYKLKMFDGRVHMIRPMLDLWERDIFEYTSLRSFPAEEKNCPYEDKTKRRFTREILESLEKDYPRSKTNIFRAMDNIYSEYLPGKRDNTH